MPRRGKDRSEEPEDPVFEDYINPLSVDDFVGTYWGKKIYASTLKDEMLEHMREAFYGGDITELAPTCR
jgi:hypothetical protein